MRNRAIFQKIQQAQTIKEMSLEQLRELDDKTLKAAVLLSKEEQREYSRYGLSIKELLFKDAVLAMRQSELDAVLNVIQLAGFPKVQGRLNGKSEIRIWTQGDMPEAAED